MGAETGLFRSSLIYASSMRPRAFVRSLDARCASRTVAVAIAVALASPLAIWGAGAGRGSVLAGVPGVPPALAAPAPAATVALLATAPGAAQTALHFASIGGRKASPPLAVLRHLPDAVVRASVVPGTTVVLATADTSPSRDASFNASLYRLAPKAEPAHLCDRVAHASRPLVTAAGRVFVSRGIASPEPSLEENGPPRLRIDTLTIDEVDPATGATRTVHTHRGYLAFLAGAWNGELVLYRVSPAHADLVAVDPDSGAERALVPSLLPFARDFSLDPAAGALVFQERHETDPGVWVVDRLDLASGKRTRLATSASNGLAPHAWPGGGLAYTPDRSAGLAVLGAAAAVRGPLGPGIDAIQAIAPDGSWVATLHTEPGAFAVPFALRTSSGAVAAIPAPAGARIAVAGFVNTQGGSR
jgi:hypothetical protein